MQPCETSSLTWLCHTKEQDQRVSVQLSMFLPDGAVPDPIDRDFLPPSIVKGRSFRLFNVHLRGEYVERVRTFKYLGTLLSDDCSLKAEIMHRCSKARKAFNMVPRGLWACMNIPLYVRWELLKHIVLPCLFYSSEAWAPTQSDVNMLESAYYDFLRIITGHTTHWHDFPDGSQGFKTPSRSEVDITLNQPNVADWLRTARLRLYGTVIRAGPSTILGKWAFATPSVLDRRRGPRCEDWATQIAGDLESIDATPAECYALAYWKARIAYSPRGPRKIEPI